MVAAVDIGCAPEGKNWGSGGTSGPRNGTRGPISEVRRFRLRSRKHQTSTPMSTRIATAATTQPMIITGFVLVLEETIVII